MITVEPVLQTNILELNFAAPFEAEDFEKFGSALERFSKQHEKIDFLVMVESIGVPGPHAIWEDLKLSPYVGLLGRAAIFTDVDWYGSLTDSVGTLVPGIQIERFDPGERKAALTWLQSSDS